MNILERKVKKCSFLHAYYDDWTQCPNSDDVRLYTVTSSNGETDQKYYCSDAADDLRSWGQKIELTK